MPIGQIDESHIKPRRPIQTSKTARSIALKLRKQDYTLDDIALKLATLGYTNGHGEAYHKSTIHYLLKGERK